MAFSPKAERVLAWLASTECAVVLFLAIAALAIPGTFTENRAIYSSPPFLLLLGAFALNLLLCTVRRWKSISRPVLVLHGGVLLTLAGCIATSFGYVATVNIYEGTTVDRVFRWDQQSDVSLGADLGIRKINREYWPVPVQVGVLQGQQKEALFTTKTGDSFQFRNYRVQVDSFEPQSESLLLSVFEGERKLGSFSTSASGMRDVPPDFPYAFVLVAYQNPRLKRQWVDLELVRDARQVAAGVSGVNQPFFWQGLYFYNTLVDRDPNGVPFAGMQIVRDPGRPYVFAGFAVMGVGAVLSFQRRLFRKGQWKA